MTKSMYDKFCPRVELLEDWADLRDSHSLLEVSHLQMEIQEMQQEMQQLKLWWIWILLPFCSGDAIYPHGAKSTAQTYTWRCGFSNVDRGGLIYAVSLFDVNRRKMLKSSTSLACCWGHGCTSALLACCVQFRFHFLHTSMSALKFLCTQTSKSIDRWKCPHVVALRVHGDQLLPGGRTWRSVSYLLWCRRVDSFELRGG